MSASPVPRDLYCLLVPLAGRKLLLPRDLVVEVMGGGGITPPGGVSPPWHLGWRDWQGERLPVVALEAYYGDPPPPRTARARLVCALAVGESGLAHYAFLTRGYPYLVRVTEGVLRPEPDETPGVWSRVRFGNDRPVVPDLFRLERDIAALAPP